MTIGVVVADDSGTVRAFLRRTLEAEGDIAVLGEARDATETLDLVETLRPQVLTLDLLMPGSGLAVLRRLMETAPLPVVVISSTVRPGERRAAVEALSLGAVDVLPKPSSELGLQDIGSPLRRAVRAAAGVSFSRRRGPSGRFAARPVEGGGPRPVNVVGMVASTGGPAAVAAILRGTPLEMQVPLLLVQHIGPDMEREFVAWLDTSSSWRVRMATDGQTMEPRTVYVGPQGTHLVARHGRVALAPARGDSTFAPSGTELLRSLAREFGAGAAGVVLTGMGDDGADGLLALRQAGGYTVAQGPESSVVSGMPRAAVDRGAAEFVLELGAIPDALARACGVRLEGS